MNKRLLTVVTIIIFIFSSTFVSFAQQDSSVEKLLEEGKKAYVNGDFKEAINKLSLAITIIKNKKDLIDAYLTLSLTYFTIGDNKKAEESIVKILRIKPSLSLNPDIYSPKFIVFVEDIKNKNMINVSVSINPGAKLYIDDLFYGKGTQFNVKLLKGKHSLKVEREGYKVYESEIEATSNSKSFIINLEKIIPLQVSEKKEIKEEKKREEGKIVKEKTKKKGGSKFVYYLGGIVAGGVVAALLLSKKSSPSQPTVLKVTSEPSEADVFIDGQNTGKVTPCEFSGIAAGRHRIEVVKEFFGKTERNVNIVEGQTTSYHAVLSPFKYEFVKKFGRYGTGNLELNFPISLTLFDNDSKLLIMDSGNHVVKVYSTKGVYLRKIPVGTELFTPVDGFRFDSGETFVVDIGADGFFKIDSSGNLVMFKGGDGDENGKFSDPFGLAVGPDNKLFIVDSKNYRVQVFNKDGSFVGKWGEKGTGGGQFGYPFDIAINKDKKRVYITDIGLHRVTVFDLNGNFKFKWGSKGSGDENFDTPTGIAVDKRGYVYVVDMNNFRVAKFTSDGKFVVNITKGSGSANGELNNPYGVAVAEDGTVYIADTENHRIQVFKISDETVSQGSVQIKVSGLPNSYHHKGLHSERVKGVNFPAFKGDKNLNRRKDRRK